MTFESKLSAGLATLVLLVGGWQAWRQLHPPAATRAPSANPAWTAPPDVDRAGWTVDWSWTADRVDRIELDVAEVQADGARRPYHGMLTLWFAEGARGDWPVRQGHVVAEPHTALIALLAESGKLGFEFRGHPRQDVAVPWLKSLTQPELLDFDLQPDHTTGVVRNRSAVAMTVRVRAGYRQGAVWQEPAGHAARTHLRLAPGGLGSFRLDYTPSADGALSPPFVRPLFGLTGDPEFDRRHPLEPGASTPAAPLEGSESPDGSAPEAAPPG